MLYKKELEILLGMFVYSRPNIAEHGISYINQNSSDIRERAWEKTRSVWPN